MKNRPATKFSPALVSLSASALACAAQRLSDTLSASGPRQQACSCLAWAQQSALLQPTYPYINDRLQLCVPDPQTLVPEKHAELPYKSTESTQKG